MKSLIIKPYARYISRQVQRDRHHAVTDQQRILKELVAKGANTAFGREHGLSNVNDHNDFRYQVPVRDYEGLKSYFDRQVEGEPNVLWPGRPKYYAKTSGTTSGIKYIPLTQDSIPNHIGTARKALMQYATLPGKANIFDGKVMFLSGSPTLGDTAGIPTGRLSGIVNHEIPRWIKGNQLPSYNTNCIEDWEEKVDNIILETKDQDLRLISGIPPWVQMYFERMLDVTGKSTIKAVFPNLQVFMYGGVNYEPYRATIESLIGERIDSIELYPASEGFLAYQDKLENEGLLLNSNSGIFFEFVPLSEFYNDSPPRFTLDQVELHRDYVVVISTNAGLWAYNLGDTVRFVNLDPYRIVVSGRVKHFISAFGEHVIGKEVEQAMLYACKKHGASITEYTVAPQVNPIAGELPYHEWYVEWENEPSNKLEFALSIDQELCRQNTYYNDLIEGKILQPLIIKSLGKDAFRKYMKSKGKLGGQNKVPRLSNDREIVDFFSL